MTSKCSLLVQMLILAILTLEYADGKRMIKAFGVGRIRGMKGKHWKTGVGGKVYVINEGTIKIKNFFFDGGHPVCCQNLIHMSLLTRSAFLKTIMKYIL